METEDGSTEECDGKTEEVEVRCGDGGKKRDGWIQGRQYPWGSQNEGPAAAK